MIYTSVVLSNTTDDKLNLCSKLIMFGKMFKIVVIYNVMIHKILVLKKIITCFNFSKLHTFLSFSFFKTNTSFYVGLLVGEVTLKFK